MHDGSTFIDARPGDMLASREFPEGMAFVSPANPDVMYRLWPGAHFTMEPPDDFREDHGLGPGTQHAMFMRELEERDDAFTGRLLLYETQKFVPLASLPDNMTIEVYQVPAHAPGGRPESDFVAAA